MSEESSNQPFHVDRAKGGRAACKGCKDKCPNAELRLAKVVPSPYGEGQSMKSWYHVDCFMTALLKQRPATKRIDSVNDIGNWTALSNEDQELLLKKINEMEELYAEKNAGKYTKKVLTNDVQAGTPKKELSSEKNVSKTVADNNFDEFTKLCNKIASVDAYTDKTAVVNKFFNKGTDKSGFKGDLLLWCKLLLPQVKSRVYNLKSKQLVKLFSRIFNADQDDMLTYLENGDIADTIDHFFNKSKTFKPADSSNLTIHNVDDFMENLSKLTKEDEQIYHFKSILKKCTSEDLKSIIRLIKGDLRINAGPKHILEAVHPDAYNVFQTSRDLAMVLDRVGTKSDKNTSKGISAKLALMTPVLPMLAEACKSVEMAMKKCPNGMFSEIKYDGERVQVHKKGKEFMYFSRALKPVMPHKVSHFKDYLPQAFPEGEDLVLDAEVLMVDVHSGKPLPFGSLGVHKQSEFKDAQVCLFVFDCLYYNGRVLLDLPIRERREVLLNHMVEVKNHVMFSEQELIKEPGDLANMIAKVLQLGLEGLVLKDLESTYEPGKRHWLKVKKDYLFDGAMADTADLVVLGAWFGSGKKGGMMSVFLMGCHDTARDRWVTVTKVHTGHDDQTLERLQKELAPLMVKISGDSFKVPNWLDCNKGLIPDFVAKDPKDQPVWEITGTEFTKANIHTADGISVRFPRVTRIRSDKNWKTATNLDELKHLFKTSKEKTDVTLLNKIAEAASTSKRKDSNIKNELEPPSKKHKGSPSKGSNIESYFNKKTTKSDEKSSSSKNSSRSDENHSKNEGRHIKVEPESPKTGRSHSKTDRSSVKSEHKSPENEQIRIKNEPSTPKHDRHSSKREHSSSKSRSSHSKERDTSKHKKSSKRERSSDANSSKSDVNETSTDKKKPFKRIMDFDDKSSDSNDYKDANNHVDSNDHSKTKKVKRDKSIDSDATICSESESLEVPEFVPKNPLPECFKDFTLSFYPDVISFPEDLRRHFERHWIGYGGTLVKSKKVYDVDFVVHRDEKIRFEDMERLKVNLPMHVRHVTRDWLIQSINEAKLCDTHHFSVIVEP